MALEFLVRNQRLKLFSGGPVVADSQQYLKARFTFSEDWQGTRKYAQFRRDGEVYTCVIDEYGETEVPWETLVDKGVVQISAFATNQQDEENKLITTNPVFVKVETSGIKETELPKTPSLGILGSHVDESLKEITDTSNQMILQMTEIRDRVLQAEEHIDQTDYKIYVGENEPTEEETNAVVWINPAEDDGGSDELAEAVANAQNAAAEVKEIYKDGMFTPLSDLLGGLGTKLKRWGAIFANKIFATNLPIVYNSVAEMKADTNLWTGMSAKTLGYYEPNDGGGASYLIREKLEADTDDGGSIHELSNGLVAELIVENGTVNVKQFGAKGDGVADDSEALQKAVNSQYDIFLPPKSIFNLMSPIRAPEKMSIFSNGNNIHYNDTSPNLICLSGFCIIENEETKLYLHGFKVKCGNSSTSENAVFMSGSGTVSHSVLDNITVLNTSIVFSCTVRGSTVISGSTFQNIEYFVNNKTMFADMSVSDCYISGNKSKESYVFVTKNVATSMFTNCFFDYFVSLVKYSESCFISSTFNNCTFQYFFRLFISEINEQSPSNGAVFNGCRFYRFSSASNSFSYDLDIFQYPWGVHCAISNQLSAYINNISYIGCVFYECDNSINIQGAGLATAIIMKGCSGNFTSVIFNPYNNPNNLYKYSYIEPLMDLVVEQLPTSPFYGQRVILESTNKFNMYLHSNEWLEI